MSCKFRVSHPLSLAEFVCAFCNFGKRFPSHTSRATSCSCLYAPLFYSCYFSLLQICVNVFNGATGHTLNREILIKGSAADMQAHFGQLLPSKCSVYRNEVAIQRKRKRLQKREANRLCGQNYVVTDGCKVRYMLHQTKVHVCQNALALCVVVLRQCGRWSCRSRVAIKSLSLCCTHTKGHQSRVLNFFLRWEPTTPEYCGEVLDVISVSSGDSD